MITQLGPSPKQQRAYAAHAATDEQQQVKNAVLRMFDATVGLHGRSLEVTVWEDEPSRPMLKSQKWVKTVQRRSALSISPADAACKKCTSMGTGPSRARIFDTDADDALTHDAAHAQLSQDPALSGACAAT